MATEHGWNVTEQLENAKANLANQEMRLTNLKLGLELQLNKKAILGLIAGLEQEIKETEEVITLFEGQLKQ